MKSTILLLLTFILTNNVNPPIRVGDVNKEPVNRFPIFLIYVYQHIVSPNQPDVCNFSPSCSHYGMQAIKKYGPIKGAIMIGDRLVRCNPNAWKFENIYYKRVYIKTRGWKLYDPPDSNIISNIIIKRVMPDYE